jgi:hypothetical protein
MKFRRKIMRQLFSQLFSCAVIAVLLSACVMDNSNQTLRELDVARRVNVQDDSETVTAESQGRQFKAVVRLRPFTPEDNQDHLYWFGVDGELPRRVVERITVERDGQEVPIPDRVYADFGAIACEPQQWLVQLFASGDRLLVRYSGSDGAGSYKAELYFKGQFFDNAIIRGGAREVVRR